MDKNKKKSAEKPQEKEKKSASKKPEPQLHPHAQKWVSVIILFAVTALFTLSLFNLAGNLGAFILNVLQTAFGKLAFLAPIIVFFAGLSVMYREVVRLKTVNYIGITLFTLSLTALLNIFVPTDEIFEVIDQGGAGGYVGLILSYSFMNIMGFWASMIVIVAILIIGLLLMLNNAIESLADSDTSLGKIISAIQSKWYDLRYGDLDNKKNKYEEEEEIIDENEPVEEMDAEDVGFIRKSVKSEQKQEPKNKEHGSDDEVEEEEEPKLEKPKVKITYKKVDVPLSLLEEGSGKALSGNVEKIKQKIQATLASFNIPVEMGVTNIGPTFTQYELIPSEGVKLSRITALQDDLALALAAHPLRIEAPIPGKSAVGVEVPNLSVATVRLKELIDSKVFKTRKSNLTVPLGKDVSGNVWQAQIEKMPHLLVAGATGSGKSVCLNTIIVSLLYQNSPETLRFIMVDPKKVELSAYANIPHLLTPVITDTKKTVNALKWAVAEMERRYNLLSKIGARNIDSYNQKVKDEKMPYIVFIIDEMADLMVAARNDVETLIIRLAQMARAVGIHLILATQRPSVDVITGLIKANVPSRIAFAVASVMDSRTILDSAGADKLVGKGDMLFMNPEHKKPVRIQGAFLSEGEVERVVEFLKEKSEGPSFDPTIVEKGSANGGNVDFTDSDNGGDEMFEEAKNVVIQMGKASTSLLQRKLKLGYSRAARIMDLLEEAGVIGPADGAKPREILITETEVEDVNEGFDVQPQDTKEVEDDGAEAEVVEDVQEEEVDDTEAEAEEANDEEVEEAIEESEELEESEDVEEEEEEKPKPKKNINADDDWLNS